MGHSEIHSTGFVLGPRGNVVVSVCSTGAIGQLVAQDIAGLVRYTWVRAGRSPGRPCGCSRT